MASNGSNLIRLSGLWVMEKETGEKYLAGSLNPSSRLLIFENRDKARASDPDYIVYLAPLEQKKSKKARELALQGRLL